MKNYATLQDLVNEVIEEKIANNEDFSAYDITKKIRELCNTGDIKIDDLDTIILGGKDTYWIDHNTVRTYVRGFDIGSNGYISEFNGTFTVYKKDPTVIDTTATSVDDTTNDPETEKWFDKLITDEDTEIAKEMLDNGFDINARDKQCFNATALIQAAQNDLYDVMRFLFEQPGLDIDAENDLNESFYTECDDTEMINLANNYKYKDTCGCSCNCEDCENEEADEENTDLVNKIHTYIDNKLENNEYVTLKNIQSRFKNDHLSLTEINNIVTDKIQYIVNTDGSSAMSNWYINW